MKILGGMKLYTMEEALAKSMKSPSFRKTYEQNLIRHQMIRQIRQNRLSKKMSQEDLAEKTNMPQSTIARIESGRHSFNLTTLFRIAKALGKEVKLV